MDEESRLALQINKLSINTLFKQQKPKGKVNNEKIKHTYDLQ